MTGKCDSWPANGPITESDAHSAVSSETQLARFPVMDPFDHPGLTFLRGRQTPCVVGKHFASNAGTRQDLAHRGEHFPLRIELLEQLGSNFRQLRNLLGSELVEHQAPHILDMAGC